MTSILSLLYVILSGSLKAIMANALTVVVVEYGSTLSSEQLELVWNDHSRLTYFSKVGHISSGDYCFFMKHIDISFIIKSSGVGGGSEWF